jgi:hypothetical protein
MECKLYQRCLRLGGGCLYFDFNLYSLRLRQRGEDKLRWDPSKRVMFDVTSFYDVLVPHDTTPSLGRIIGGIRPLSEQCSLLGQPT